MKINYGVARISISGLKHSGVGEAAGAVFPITGEGIRASIIHAKLISKNEDVSKSSLYRIIKEQINIINEAKNGKKPGEYISRVFVGKSN